MLSKDGIKMKKAILATLLSATALTLFAAPASAATKNTKTDVGVQFKSDDPTVETGDEMKPYKNNLAVIFKPGSFEFGEVKSQIGSKTLNNIKGTNNGLDATISPTGQYLVVNDDRDPAKQTGGTNGAWNLTAQLSDLQTADKAEKLTSAKLEFRLDGLKKYNIGTALDTTGNDYIPAKPWDADVVTDFATNDSGVVAPDATKTLTLEAGVAQQVPILSKTAANSYRSGVITSIRDVKLSVIDANQKDKAFTGTITWTLDDLEKIGG